MNANSAAAFFRFGKLERVISTPGLSYVTPGASRVDGFAGTQSLILPPQNIIDSAGNPIIVRALLEYSVDDPAALCIATNNTPTVLFNMAEQVVRETCAGMPLQGHPEGRDLRSQGHAVSNLMVAELQIDASVMGVTVQRLVITEARYAPEIMQQMLMKQQAQALIGARKEIAAGALGIVHDTVAAFPDMSREGKERIVTNLLATLTSHAPTVTTVSV